MSKTAATAIVEPVVSDDIDTDIETTEEKKRGRKAASVADIIARSNDANMFDNGFMLFLKRTYKVKIDKNARRVAILAQNGSVRTAWLKSAEYDNAKTAADIAVYEAKRVEAYAKMSPAERALIESLPKDVAETMLAAMVRMLG